MPTPARRQEIGAKKPMSSTIAQSTRRQLPPMTRRSVSIEPSKNVTDEDRNDLAGAYMNRGNAKQSAAGHGEALPDHQTAQDLLSAWCWREEAA